MTLEMRIATQAKTGDIFEYTQLLMYSILYVKYFTVNDFVCTILVSCKVDELYPLFFIELQFYIICNNVNITFLVLLSNM